MTLVIKVLLWVIVLVVPGGLLALPLLVSQMTRARQRTSLLVEAQTASAKLG